jgi:CMP/dCMP kinase
MPYLDTGAMYRAVAFSAIRQGVDPEDAKTVAELTSDMKLEVAERVVVDDVDATIEIRSPEVTRAVSVVAANPLVRKELVRRQREWADREGSGVVEGRDIGTVVFPEAPVKVYMTASDEERAQRRSQELLDMHYDEVAADIARRDHIDSTRQYAPLSVAPDAVVVDTTTSTVDEVVELVLALAAKAGLE